MKKLLAFLLVIILCWTLCACNNNTLYTSDYDTDYDYSYDSEYDSNYDTSSDTCVECGNIATKTYINPLSNEVEHYCLTHYNEIIDIMSGMEEDVGDSKYNSHTCEECNREGTHKYESFTGQTEYYCTQHYEELNDLLNSFGLD